MSHICLVELEADMLRNAAPAPKAPAPTTEAPNLMYYTKADLTNVHFSHLHFISKAGRTDSPNGHLFLTKHAL
jgi:hypothetical protein